MLLHYEYHTGYEGQVCPSLGRRGGGIKKGRREAREVEMSPIAGDVAAERERSCEDRLGIGRGER